MAKLLSPVDWHLTIGRNSQREKRRMKRLTHQLPPFLSCLYKDCHGESASQLARPEGLGALTRRVLDYQGGPVLQGRPFFIALNQPIANDSQQAMVH
jgi:hypothetical protein